MLSSAKGHVSCTKLYWFENTFELWHPVELVGWQNASGTLSRVKRMDNQGILNYFQMTDWWVNPRSLECFEDDPNELFTPHQVEYSKSIHPYIYALRFYYKINNQRISHLIKNTTNRTVHILLFITGHSINVLFLRYTCGGNHRGIGLIWN